MDLESRKAKEPKEPKSLNFLLHKKLEYPLEGSNYRNLRILSEACVKQYTPPPGVDSKFDLIHPKSPRQLSALSSMAQQFFDTNKAEFLSETWTKDKLARETEQVKSVVQRMMQRNLSKERGEMHEEHLQPAEHVSDHPRQVPRDARASHLGEPELSPGMKTPSFLNSEGPEVQQGINPGGAQTTVLESHLTVDFVMARLAKARRHRKCGLLLKTPPIKRL
ncbi:MAG: hypothetical protein M1838_005293 [Thelocarpon superellum]|nr:MAG: hypothetical protein M1838_005293 [Thelocarpon superellum]